jgi:serine/threonine-protein kinase
MSGVSTDLEALLARFIEEHVGAGRLMDVRDLCGARADLVDPLTRLIDEYLSLTAALDADPLEAGPPPGPSASLPRFDGFHTIERLGAGGMGEVFKLRDLRLGRLVAAKVIRRDARVPTGLADFLREARALALFSDPRIVSIFEVRPEADPPVLVMEYVDGFELGRLGPSLEFGQRARILLDVCEAVQHAHALGIQHRDLKPSNIMLDAQLSPRILDFGLSGGDPRSGHLKGTLPYVAPEQLDPARAIDARTDVYALGAILYELLCGRPPYGGSEAEMLAGIRAGTPRLPVEIDPRVPEPLQAIALQAMEADPDRRYASAADMAADLRRFLDARPVLARPSLYATTLGARTRPHLEQIGEWQRLRLIHPHEAERLRLAYRDLDAREDDWIVESRALTYTQIALYLGAFLLVAGSVFYFVAERWHHAVDGLARPLAVLGLPFIGLNAAALLLYRRERKAVAVAFALAAVALLPLVLIIAFDETGLLVAAAGTAGQLFQDGSIANRQLQVTTAVTCLWCGWLATATRTAGLSTAFAALLLLVGLSGLTDLGLRTWLEEGRWDLLALHLSPIAGAYALIGWLGERTTRPWMAKPMYVGGALMVVLTLELLALDGRMFEYIGFTLRAFQPGAVSDPRLLDTLTAMTLNGLAFYLIAAAIARRGTRLQSIAAGLLFSLAPFALLQPLGYLVRTGEYSPRYDWIYLASALAIAVLSEKRQRRAFYYAGVLNTGSALYFVAAHREWFDNPWWAMAVIAAGLAALAGGFLLDRRGIPHP